MSYSEAELQTRYRTLDSGWHEAALDELAEIIAHAEAGGYHRLAFRARRDLADRHCVSGQWEKGFPLFARCLAEFDSRPEDFGPHEEYSLRSWYVRTVTTMAEYPEISVEQITGLHADIRRRFAAHRHSLAGLHTAERWLAYVRGDWAAEEVAYRQWHLAGGPRPNYMWDFENEIERLVHRGDRASVDRALALAEPVLDGRLTFAESTAPIEAHMLPFWATRLPPERVAEVFQRMDRGFDDGGPWRYEYPSKVIEFLALTGNEAEAFERYRRRMCHFTTLSRPYGRMEFATSCAVALGRLVRLGRGPEAVPCRGCSGKHPTKTLSERHNELRAEALALAATFDARNGTTWQTEQVTRRLSADPLLEFLPLRPGARPVLHRVSPIGCTPDVAVHAARWLLDRGLGIAAGQYLGLVGEPTDPAVAAGVLELKARRADDDTTLPRLREAAAAFAAAGEPVRGDLCLVAAAGWLRFEKRWAEALEELSAPLERLRAEADPESVGHAEVTLAALQYALERDGNGYPLIEEVVRRAEMIGDPRLLGEARYQYGWMRQGRGDDVKLIAVDYTAAVCALAAGGADFRARQVLNQLGTLFGKTKDWPALLDSLDRCQSALPPHTGRLVIAALRWLRGETLHSAGRNEEALVELSFAAHEYDAIDILNTSKRAHWVKLAEVCAALSDWEQALRHSEYACAWADRARRNGALGDAVTMVTGRSVLADSLRELGRLDRAVSEYHTLVDEALAADRHHTALYAHSQAGDLLLRLNRPAAAATDFHVAADLSAQAPQTPRVLRTLRMKEVIAHVRAGAVDAAETALEQARAIEATASDHAARLDLAIAHVLFARGKTAAALEHTVRAQDTLQATGYYSTAGMAALFLAQQHLAAARPDLAVTVLRSSIPRYPKDEPVVDELSALLGSLEAQHHPLPSRR
ncbi:hypothetical protein [Nocardia rosealba]|uniref:hypothetical protein n=1 Tax=Nocardia rosealba TaxID=2878563 RepID=UPI001CD9EC5E|nr:hypothetical protein [Nocardia rosealba]MCA2206067.1 hypothetical protein [Nocardia rosealba]